MSHLFSYFSVTVCRLGCSLFCFLISLLFLHNFSKIILSQKKDVLSCTAIAVFSHHFLLASCLHVCVRCTIRLFTFVLYGNTKYRILQSLECKRVSRNTSSRKTLFCLLFFLFSSIPDLHIRSDCWTAISRNPHTSHQCRTVLPIPTLLLP